MQRRDFIKQTSGAGLTAVAAGAAMTQAIAGESDDQGGKRRFKLQYAPHFGLFEHSAGKDFVDQIKYAADQGFTAWEDNGMPRRSVDDQNRIAGALESLGMTMGVFVATFGGIGGTSWASGNNDAAEKIVAGVQNSIEVARRVNAKWMTVVPGNYDPTLEWGFQTAHVIDLLRRCAEILEPHGLVMVLEPLNWWRDHPELFLHKIPQAFEICRAVDSPSCKILFDIYHQQIQEGNLIPNIDRAWDEIAYFQIGDNPGRKEPGTGEINYRNVFKHLHAKGFHGVLGMEHGKSIGGPAGEKALVDAYVTADDF